MYHYSFIKNRTHIRHSGLSGIGNLNSSCWLFNLSLILCFEFVSYFEFKDVGRVIQTRQLVIPSAVQRIRNPNRAVDSPQSTAIQYQTTRSQKTFRLIIRIYRGSIWRIHQFKRKIQNRAFDFIYAKGNLGEFGASEYAEFGAHPAQSSGIWLLSYIFRKIYHIKPSDVLVDVGCGLGRVILWWLSQRYNNKIIGLEIDEKIAQAAGKRLNKYENVQIITGDAVVNIPSDGTLFYLFNPFGADQMKRFKARLEEMFIERGNVTIVYYYCRQIELFRNDPLWTIDEIRHPDLPKNHNPPMPWAAIIKMVDSCQ